MQVAPPSSRITYPFAQGAHSETGGGLPQPCGGPSVLPSAWGPSGGYASSIGAASHSPTSTRSRSHPARTAIARTKAARDFHIRLRAAALARWLSIDLLVPIYAVRALLTKCGRRRTSTGLTRANLAHAPTRATASFLITAANIVNPRTIPAAPDSLDARRRFRCWIAARGGR